MREMILAIRAIWDCWNNGTKLDFRGDFYTHTLMTPFFNPGPNPYGTAEVFLAGVGELMTEVAGEVCDGFLCHGFTTERYLREVTIPALERGRAKAGKTLDGFEIVGPVVRRHRHERGGDREAPPPAPASRSRSTARRPRTAACSSCTAGAACRTSSTRCRSRASGSRWASSSTTRSSTTFAVVGRARADRPRAAPPLRRRHRPHQLLRAVQDRPRALAGSARRPQSRLEQGQLLAEIAVTAQRPLKLARGGLRQAARLHAA